MSKIRNAGISSICISPKIEKKTFAVLVYGHVYIIIMFFLFDFFRSS